jgi:hypothetical protein
LPLLTTVAGFSDRCVVAVKGEAAEYRFFENAGGDFDAFESAFAAANASDSGAAETGYACACVYCLLIFTSFLSNIAEHRNCFHSTLLYSC